MLWRDYLNMNGALVLKEYFLQTCCVLVFAYFFHKFIKHLLLLRKLPPGPIGLPLVGYLPFIGKKPDETFRQLSKKYGSITCINVGNKYAVVLNDFDTMKEILCHPLALDKDVGVFAHVPEIGFAYKKGDEWQEQRRFSMHSMKNLGLGRGPWQILIEEEVPIFLEKLRKLKGQPAETDEILAHTIHGNILSLLIGRRLEKEKEGDYIELTSKFTEAAVQSANTISLLTTVPGLRPLLKWLRIGKSRRVMKIMSEFSKATKNEIRKHKTDEDLAHVTDFINIYLKKLKSMTRSNAKHYFTERNVEGNVHILFLGGSHTVWSSIEWSIRFMAAYPEIQKKVQEELDDVMGTDGKVTYEDRFKIPYTFATLMESQRVSSIVPLSPTRQAREDIVFRGYIIPKGTSITANLAAIHHDPKYWDHPEKFNPERFLSEDGSKFFTNLPGYAPFTMGRRSCPGELVAWMEILPFFTSIMQKFTVSFPPGVEPTFEYKSGIVKHLVPQKLCYVERTG